ncbi:MAG: carboxypeptidase-like regulatory domain-containing protein [Acidobacteriota bacterium]
MQTFFLYRSVVSLSLLTILVLAPLSTVRAQDPVTGAIEGYVLDNATKAPIAGALVQFVNTESGAVLAKRTNDQGYYRQGLLPPGEYRIRVSAQGYATPPDQLFTNYATRPNSVRPPFYLTTEAATLATATPGPTPTTGQPAGTPSPSPQTTTSPTTGTGTARGPSVASEMNLSDARRSGAYTDKEVSTLPLGGTTLTRSFDELGLLVPGVALPPQTQSDIAGPGVGPSVGSAGQFSVNGMRSRANNFTVDGSDNNDEDIGVRRQGFFSLVPQPIESIKEFQITTLLAPAQYGRNFGGQVNALSKSGGNNLHGTIFGFFNSSQLNARNFFDTTNGNGTTALRSSTGQSVLNCTGIPFITQLQFSTQCTARNTAITTTNQSGGEDSFTLGQGGFVLGGPIKRDKAFFFISYENQVLNARREASFAVPTVDQRGIFRSGATGFYIDCLDANPGFNISNCTNANRTQFFPDFGYPTELHGDAVFSLFPFANNPTGVYGANTFTESLPASARGNIASGKYDQNFSLWGKPQTLTARYNFTQDWRDIAVTGGALFSSLRPRVRTQNFSTFLTSALTNSMSNVLRLSYGRTRLAFEELRNPFLIPSEISPNEPFLLNARRLQNDTLPLNIGLPNTGPVFYSNVGTTECGSNNCNFGRGIGRVGQISVAGFSPIGVDTNFFPQRRVNNTYQIADTLGYRAGNHSLAFGEDIRRVELNSDLPRNSRTLLSFNGSPELDFFGANLFTGNFLTGADLAAAGAPSGAFLSLARTGSAIGLRYYQYNFFGQDEWRIRKNLTLNFGLRYEYNTPPKERSNLIERTFSDPLLNNPNVADLRTFIAGRTQIFESDKNNFEPRFGLAWSPNWFGQDHSTVIRAGFGVFHDQILGAVVSQSRNVFPNFITVNTGGFNDGFQFDFFNPARGGIITGGVFAPLVQPGTLNTFNPNLTVAQVLNVFASGANFPNPVSITLPERNIKTPSAEQYSVTFEQQINSNMLISAAYIGTRGHNLLRGSTPNLGPNNILIAFDAGALNGYGVDEPILVGLAIAPGSTTTTNFDRPNPNIGPVYIYESGGRSHYNAFQVQFSGRFRRGLQYQANYTFGEARDDASDMFDLAGAPALPQNSLTRAGEFGYSSFDARHRVAYNLIYDFPKSSNWLLDGLQIATTGSFQTGPPFTVNSIYDVNLDGNLTDRLNSAQGIVITGDRRQPIAISSGINPQTLLAAVGRDGSLGRNTFRAGNILNMDLAVVKNFSFSENRRLVFRMDVFNFINRANFGIPVRFLEAPSFGQATGTVTPGRRVQFGLKFGF